MTYTIEEIDAYSKAMVEVNKLLEAMPPLPVDTWRMALELIRERELLQRKNAELEAANARLQARIDSAMAIEGYNTDDMPDGAYDYGYNDALSAVKQALTGAGEG